MTDIQLISYLDIGTLVEKRVPCNSSVFSIIGQNIQQFAYNVKYIWLEKWTLVNLISHAH